MLKLVKELWCELYPFLLTMYIFAFLLVCSLLVLGSATTGISKECRGKALRIEYIFPARPLACKVSKYTDHTLQNLVTWLFTPPK